MTARFTLALAAVLLTRAAVARADAPRIDLSRCTVLDDAEARTAIAAELTSIPAERAAHLGEVVVAITCEDAVTATVTVTPAPADGPLEKQLDLGDLPADLRTRGIALAVAELVDLALDVASAPAPAPPPPSPHGEGGVDAASFVPHPIAPPSQVAIVVAPRPRWRAAARAGVLVFVDRAAPLTDVAGEVSRGRLALDLFVATARADDTLGDVRSIVGAIGLTVTVACRGGVGTWLCLGARGAAGVAAVTVDPVHPMIIGHDAVSTYVELGPRLEIRVEHRRWSGSLALGLAWASGLSALADGREIVRLGGPVVGTSLGIGWGR
jgi:hypothetical protein